MTNFKRKESSIYNIRIFHNWVKNETYKKAADEIRKSGDSDIDILELAMRKAGDLYKWIGIEAKTVLGIDLRKESIFGKNGAFHRYRKMVKRSKYNKELKVPKCNFYVFDISDPANLEPIKTIMKNKKFNLVSCHFAIHYFFKSEENLDFLMGIIDHGIKPGGKFIGTTMNGGKVKDLFSESEKVQKNIFSAKKGNFNDTPYGNEVIIQLGKKGEDHYFAQESSIEYTVHPDDLVSKCEQYGLVDPVLWPFEDMYKKYESMDPEHKLTEDDKEFSFLNFAFLFTKK